MKIRKQPKHYRNGKTKWKFSESYSANIAMSPEMKPYIISIFHDLLNTVKPDVKVPKTVAPMWFGEKDSSALSWAEPQGEITYDHNLIQ